VQETAGVFDGDQAGRFLRCRVPGDLIRLPIAQILEFATRASPRFYGKRLRSFLGAEQ
jgi:hypothetical protein